ncbi:Alpha-L-fucosidase [Aphelenchoides fujianensis]|nr:Alpha-L-fucosidase [Aphelenchoides fujianensis]
MAQHYANGTTYADFARDFTAAEFDAAQFADVIHASGARYCVLTAKHHEGFTLWPSATAFGWNAVDVGAHRDLVGELATSIRARDLHFGLYFSQMDWFHPLYLQDKKQNSSVFPEQVSLVQMRELVAAYRPDVLWSDGDWERPPEYWRSREFLAWLFNDSPVREKVLVNDRWGVGTAGQHGSFLNHADGFLPGHLLTRKWESCITLDEHSWGYRRDLQSGDVKSTRQVVALLAQVLAWGGNLLLNVGPNRLGRIPPIFEDRLRDVGAFVGANAEAIFESKPWVHQNDSQAVFYTSRVRSAAGLSASRPFNPQNQTNTLVYAFVLEWDESGLVQLPSVKWTPKTVVSLLGTPRKLRVVKPRPLTVQLPPLQALPHRAAAVLRIEFAGDSTFTPKVRRP